MAIKSIHNAVSSMLYSLFLWSCIAAVKSDMLMEDLLKTTPQDFTHFVQDTSLLDKPVVSYNAEKVQEDFLSHYFSPWDSPLAFFSPEILRKKEEDRLQRCYQKPGWGLSGYQNTDDLIKSIDDNMALSDFPNQKHRAIVVRTTHLRSVPSMEFSFGLPRKAGEGYPFDNWQESLLSPNEPIYVLHTSQDQAWNYVITGSYINGWVQRADIAYVTDDFITQWKTGKYATPLREKLPIKGNVAAPLSRVGQLIPIKSMQDDEENYRILTVASDPAGMATTQVSTVGKEDVAILPLLATPNNMMRLASSLMGDPYSWGGITGSRDCSSTLKDIFTSFGIWLPRDSGPQSKAGTFVSLEGLSNDQKERVIREQGIPFFSLIWMPGHITLYLGEKDEKTHIYHDIWGLRTKNETGEEGRAILGKTLIMPLDLGKEYSDIEQTCLDKAKGLILLTDRLVSPERELELFKK